MRISATEEYGLRCLLQVARQQPGSLISASAIADAEGISTQYASKMMHLFRKAGLVESIRGLHGGFKLCREPGDISLYTVFTALAPQADNRDFCDKFSGDSGTCVHLGECSVRPVWTVLLNYFDSVLRELTVADLLSSEYRTELRVSRMPGLELRRLPAVEKKGVKYER